VKIVSHSQRKTLHALACLTLLHGRSPTLRELGHVFGCSKPAALYRLRWLEKKGLCSAERRALTETGLQSALEALG
jgi:hypothetical protein